MIHLDSNYIASFSCSNATINHETFRKLAFHQDSDDYDYSYTLFGLADYLKFYDDLPVDIYFKYLVR